MRYFWLSSFLLIVLSGCFQMNISTATSEDCIATSTWKLIAPETTAIKYKADVTLYGKYFSGILMFKAITDSTCRVLFSSITGAKYFEILLLPHKDSVVYAMQQLSNPQVITIVSNDLRTLTSLHKFDQKPVCIKLNEETSPYILQSIKDKDVYRYFYGRKFTRLNHIEVLNKRMKNKINFDLKYRDESIVAQEIAILHLNVKLKILLTNF